MVKGKKGSGEMTPGATSRAVARPETMVIPIDRLCESPTNPRSEFRDLQELATSIQANGLINPILVRPIDADNPLFDGERAAHAGFNGGKAALYEIVAGARRYRACKIAGLAAVPANVEHLDDRQMVVKQYAENKDRHDLHPLDEAALFAGTMDRGMDVGSLSVWFGRSESYIKSRLTLRHLIDAFRQMFLEEKIFFTQALMISRLQPADQEHLAEHLFAGPDHTPSVAELRMFIQSHYLLCLAGAAFGKDDAHLVEAAGPCTKCQKRTGANKMLWPEIAERDTCTDGRCYQAKVRAHIERVQADLRAKGDAVIKVSTNWGKVSAPDIVPRGNYRPISDEEAKLLPATEVRTAIIAEGQSLVLDEKGRALGPPGSTMKVHVAPDRPAGPAKQPVDPEEERRLAIEAAKDKRRADRQQAINLAVLDAILEAATFPRYEDLSGIAGALWEGLSEQACRLVFRHHGWMLGQDELIPISPVSREEAQDWTLETWISFLMELDYAETATNVDGGLPSRLASAAIAYKVDLAEACNRGREAFKAAQQAGKEASEQPTACKAKPAGKGRGKKGDA